MSGLPSGPCSSVASEEKIKSSQSEVQTLIEQDVDRALKKSDTNLQHLIETIRQLDHRVDRNWSVGDEALETVQQSKNPADTTNIESTDKHDEHFWLMETTQSALKKMHDDKEALTAAVADVRKELRPPVLTSHGSPELKKVPEYSLEKESNAEAVEGPRVDMVWKESVSPAVSSKTPKWAESEQDRPLYPAPPPITFPSVLSRAAAS